MGGGDGEGDWSAVFCCGSLTLRMYVEVGKQIVNSGDGWMMLG